MFSLSERAYNCYTSCALLMHSGTNIVLNDSKFSPMILGLGMLVCTVLSSSMGAVFDFKGIVHHDCGSTALDQNVDLMP